MIIIDEAKYNLLKKHLQDANVFTEDEIDVMMSVFTTEEKVNGGLKTIADWINERENS